MTPRILTSMTVAPWQGVRGLLSLVAASVTAHAAVVITPVSSNGVVLPYAAQVSAVDLINDGQPFLAGATVSATHGAFPGAGINDGSTSNGVPGGNTFFEVGGGHFSPAATATYDLNVSVNPAGYDITSIVSFMGWAGTSSQAQGNQTYTVEVSVAGSPAYTALTAVSYLPFPDVNSTNFDSKVIVTDTGGVLATGVDSIRFTFTNPLLAVANGPGNIEGTLVREIDVFGYPTGGPPPVNVVTVTAPVPRQIIQRNSGNLGAIPVRGNYSGSPAGIEARVQVMSGGSNSGTGTAWTTIASPPAGGTFSGSLTNVASGGWYQLEVRSVTAGVPGTASVIPRIGVGDIYVTSGQSNSANYGSPAASPADDRVSAWNYASGSWTKAADPMPGCDGGGGSVWSRLGDQLAARDNIPVAFACTGVGATMVSQWVPDTGSYYPRIAAAVRAFPQGGFRGVLWHQGESDSLVSTTPASYQGRLESIITRSRSDAGWQVPWFIAEVGFHPGSTLAQEERIVAGQRRAIYADPLVFPGPVTDDFHREAKLSDSVHFNAAGLADHASQWAAVLGGTPAPAPKNGDFESNTALADGSIHVISMSDSSSPSVIGWRALAAGGESVADGSCGYYNPNDGFYPGTADTGASSGAIPGMAGRHIAFINGSSPGAHFLQTLRRFPAPHQLYTLTASLGVRGNGNVFGGAVLELLADGAVLASRTVTRAELDALRGGNAANTFSDVALTFTTGASVTAGQALALRLTNPGGTGTYLDFDNVRFSAVTSPYHAWALSRGLDGTPGRADDFGGDPDGDLIANGLEWILGGDPLTSDAGLLLAATVDTAGGFRVSFRRAESSPGHAAFSLEWSIGLDGLWFTVPIGAASSGPDANGVTVSVNAAPSPDTIIVTIPGDRVFVRLRAVSP